MRNYDTLTVEEFEALTEAELNQLSEAQYNRGLLLVLKNISGTLKKIENRRMTGF